MQEYVVNMWFGGRAFLPDVTLMIRAARALEVGDVAEGALRLLGEYCAAHIEVLDVVKQQKTTLTHVVLNV